jgi:Fe-S-cluster containining protein
MDQKEIKRIFYRDGYRLAQDNLGKEVTASNLRRAIDQLFRAVDELLASFLERSSVEGVPADCKKGCRWCCYQEVYAVTHEFLYLHDYILHNFPDKKRADILVRAGEKIKRTMNRQVEEQLKVRYACPFLQHSNCLVYRARPMACRIYLSSSVHSCKRDHDQPANRSNIPELYEFPLLAGRMFNEGFVAYLKLLGLRTSELPLEQGYASVVRLDQTMEEWIDGRRASS